MSIAISVNLFDDYINAIYEFQYLRMHSYYNEIVEKVKINSIVDILKKQLLDILELNYDLFETNEMKTYILSQITYFSNDEQYVLKSDFIQSSNILKVYHYLLSNSNNLFYLLMGNEILDYANETTINTQPTLLGLDWKMMCFINHYRNFCNEILDEKDENILFKYKKSDSEIETVEHLFPSFEIPDDIYKLNIIENNDGEIKYFDFKQLLDDFFHSQHIQLDETEIKIIHL